MAQVTMEGMEYVNLIGQVNKLEAEKSLLIKTFVLGTLEVDKEARYKKVSYKVAGELPEDPMVEDYVEMRFDNVAAQLENNPLGVQILYDEGDVYFNPYSGNFTSYDWDEGRKHMKLLSTELARMIEKLEQGIRLVEEPKEEEVEVNEDGE